MPPTETDNEGRPAARCGPRTARARLLAPDETTSRDGRGRNAPVLKCGGGPGLHGRRGPPPASGQPRPSAAS
eukprot:6661183-Lingulodinium_polyedra.AAC.1